MSEKWRDSKGRVLRNGESRRPDGKYMFRCTDSTKERHILYIWKLVSTDKENQMAVSRCWSFSQRCEPVFLPQNIVPVPMQRGIRQNAALALKTTYIAPFTTAQPYSPNGFRAFVV